MAVGPRSACTSSVYTVVVSSVYSITSGSIPPRQDRLRTEEEVEIIERRKAPLLAWLSAGPDGCSCHPRDPSIFSQSPFNSPDRELEGFEYVLSTTHPRFKIVCHQLGRDVLALMIIAL